MDNFDENIGQNLTKYFSDSISLSVITTATKMKIATQLRIFSSVQMKNVMNEKIGGHWTLLSSSIDFE